LKFEKTIVFANLMYWNHY